MADAINNGIELVKDTPYRGKDVWYFIQSTDAAVGSKAILPAHQESGDTSIEGDSLDEQSKMGRIVAPSTNEDSIEVTSYIVPGDKATDVIINAKHEGKQVKVWRVIVDSRLAVTEGDHKVYPAMFGYGIVDSADISDEDSFSEIDWTINILGKLVDGTFPLTDAQTSVLQELYDYERPGEKTGEFADTADSTTTSETTGS
ncbi:phage major tail protein, TP901-1 family [Ligilactobacillus sp. WILCCON 0076]|uniref:Phage major tail protein, TP901-1 family n=1 Tax=Ligilactobacillus ubinensis TaxID=2876789 RepID=A0A9X2FKC3_9LACO|nr:phage major tail protein, TP901-1 family [Ligilactobacillus ubinensis]MCP0885918.1 phage major tail protein, TP901-1 family [Ligilactobacillus ubinensis]